MLALARGSPEASPSYDACARSRASVAPGVSEGEGGTSQLGRYVNSRHGRQGRIGLNTLAQADGFRATTIRSIVTGVAALSNPGFPHRVFAKLPDATHWMCEDSVPGARPLEARQIEALVQHARASAAVARGPGQRPPAKESAVSVECR
jgi:hypothetical protein